jgi:hypothetical protein
MSALQWKRRLEESQELLALNRTAANEWKLVAENRKALLLSIHEVLGNQLEGLSRIGSIFGCESNVEPELLCLPTGATGSELADGIGGQVHAVAQFVSAFTNEATTLQLALSDTLGLAELALAPERPTEDLDRPSPVSPKERINFPISHVYARLNDDIPNSPVHKDKKTALVKKRVDSAVMLPDSSVEDLFRK